MADLDTLTLPVLPLTNDVVLPHMVVTLALETDEARAAADAAGRANDTLLHVPPLPDGEVTEDVADLATELRAALRALFESLGGRRLTEVLRGVDDPSALADIVGWWPDLAVERKVELLETPELVDRLRLVLAWVKEALAEHELADKIRHDVSDGLESRQREFLLRQQMDAIRKELGEDGGDDLA